MDASNLDKILTLFEARALCGERDEELDIIEAARAELAALRAATPKIDGVPTVEGWYWHREKNSRLKGVPWSLVWTNGVRTLSDGDREIVIWTQPVEEGSAQQTDIQDFEFAKHEFYGPLTPPKETP